jgi:hypothetical protein
MNQAMTPDEEYEFCARPENQEPQGPGRRRLTATVPVRSRPSCWSKSALQQPQMTAPYRPGSAEIRAIESNLGDRGFGHSFPGAGTAPVPASPAAARISGSGVT